MLGMLLGAVAYCEAEPLLEFKRRQFGRVPGSPRAAPLKEEIVATTKDFRQRRATIQVRPLPPRGVRILCELGSRTNVGGLNARTPLHCYLNTFSESIFFN